MIKPDAHASGFVQYIRQYFLAKQIGDNFVMVHSKTSKLNLSVHAGSKGDPQYHGLVTPIYPSSAYDYESEVLYPRYFNTPNQKAVAEKMAALENGEDAIVLSSGMAAIMT